MAAGELPPEVAERLGPYYVYLLVDPTDETIFYVGKGTGQRLLAHGREADLTFDEPSRSPKVRRIRALREAGHEPRIDIVRHGLVEDEAWLVEAAVIDCLDGLTNSIDGRVSGQGRQPMSEYVSRYGAPSVAGDAPPVVLIRVGRWREMREEIEPGVWRPGNGYYPGISDRDLIDSTRAWWRISPATIRQRQITHAVSVFDGVTRAIMEIGSWTQRQDGRRAFSATPVVDGPMHDAWVGALGRRVAFVAAARNPIVYWPLKSAQQDRG